MSKHWIVDGNGFSKSWNISNSEGSICDVTTSREDAELMAAAPELLDAAKAFMRIVYNDVGITREHMKLLREAGLQEAIAKTEGK